MKFFAPCEGLHWLHAARMLRLPSRPSNGILDGAFFTSQTHADGMWTISYCIAELAVQDSKLKNLIQVDLRIWNVLLRLPVLLGLGAGPVG